jgi:anti-sigma factor RsiW
MHPEPSAISEYMDGTLAPAERAELEQHLQQCGACRALADELREIVRTAAALPLADPPGPAWARIARQIERGRPGRHVRLRWLAAAAVLAAITAVGLRVAFTNRADTISDPETIATAQQVEAELLQAEQHYQKAISGLEQIANAGRGSLDPQTAATLQKNLAVVDQAIDESRTALKAQPDSEPAQQSLLENFKSKISLLQDTIALINEMRKGDDAGAARIVAGFKQKGN